MGNLRADGRILLKCMFKSAAAGSVLDWCTYCSIGTLQTAVNTILNVKAGKILQHRAQWTTQTTHYC